MAGLRVLLSVCPGLARLLSFTEHLRQRGNEEVIVAPSARGIALIRMIVTNRNNKEELAKLSEVQKKSFVEPITDGAY